MSGLNFNTSNMTFRQLMATGETFQVPLFQRDYSWGEYEWEDLWQDIQETANKSNKIEEHYMGFMVLQTIGNKKNSLIDGQQRITTLTLIILAIIARLESLSATEADPDSENNKQRAQKLRDDFVGYLDLVSMETESKLELNRNNNFIFQHYLVTLEKPPKRVTPKSNKILIKAYEWFKQKIEKQYEGEGAGRELASFVESLVDKLIFTIIRVGDALNAYKVFETLNARGVKLSSSDLLKNFFFSFIDSSKEKSDKSLESFETRWTGMVDKLGDQSLPDFLRASWNSRHKFVRHSDLFRRINKEIRTRESVFGLMKNLEQDAEVYGVLNNSEDGFWNPQGSAHIKELKNFNMRLPYPLILAAYRHLNESDFVKLLGYLSTISFRYNIIANSSPNEQELLYANVAVKLSGNQISTLHEILQELREIYLDDEKFKIAFANKSFNPSPRNKPIVRYILFKLAEAGGEKLDSNDDKITVEHILPENPEDGWDEFSDDDVEQFRYRLGNLTLLEAGKNRDLGNSSFEKKCEVYQTSSIEPTRMIAAKYSRWEPKDIRGRQNDMANKAVSIWKISQLG